MARLCAPAMITECVAVAGSRSVPVSVTKTGRSSSASAGIVTAYRWPASCHTRAAIRSVGTKPLDPSSGSAGLQRLDHDTVGSVVLGADAASRRATRRRAGRAAA